MTYFTNLKDRATLEITDFEWKLVEFSYRLQVSGESSLGHIGPKTYLKSPITSRRPEEKYCLCRPFLYVAQKKKFPLRYLYVAQKKKISLLHATHQMLAIVKLYRTPYDASLSRGSGCASDATHALFWAI